MIILASGSPRRRALLAQAGYSFERTSADIDESVYPGEDPIDYTRRVSKEKALAVRDHVPENAIVITADTTVVNADTILGKPADALEAKTMLEQLRNRTHQVITAFCVLNVATGKMLQQHVCTDVTMRDYTDEEITAYVASGDPMDKAGGYAIQNPDFAPVANIDGCYASVVGLPLCQVTAMLEQMGHPPEQPPGCTFPADCTVQIK